MDGRLGLSRGKKWKGAENVTWRVVIRSRVPNCCPTAGNGFCTATLCCLLLGRMGDNVGGVEGVLPLFRSILVDLPISGSLTSSSEEPSTHTTSVRSLLKEIETSVHSCSYRLGL